MSNYIVVGGGWAGTSGTNEPFIRIRFRSSVPESTTLTMWKNKNKSTEKHPDYLIMAAVKEDERPTTPEKIF